MAANRFQPIALREARAAKGVSMAAIAEAVGISRQAVSAFEREHDNASPTPENLRAIAGFLGKPVQFFLRSRSMRAERTSARNFRKLSAATQKSRRAIAVKECWLADIYGIIAQYVDVPRVNIPQFHSGRFEDLSGADLDELAVKLRRHWGLGLGPISNVITLLENKGVVCARVQIRDDLDAFSVWRSDHPSILIGNHIPWARSRFDAAHELAHLILHRELVAEDLEDKETLRLVENQAHRFAGAFLMPAETFPAEVFSLSIPELTALKERWGASIQAILMRCEQLDCITESQKRYAFQRLSMRPGGRKVEPLDRQKAPERPMFMSKALTLLEQSGMLDGPQLSSMLGLSGDELAELTSMEPEVFQPKNIPDNVVQLKVKDHKQHHKS